MNRSTRNIPGNCLIQEHLLGSVTKALNDVVVSFNYIRGLRDYIFGNKETKSPPPTYRNSSYLSASLRPSHSSCLLRLPHLIILPRCLGCLIEKACIIIHTYIVASQINNLNWQHLTREFVPRCFLNLPQLVPQAVCVTFLISGCD